VMMALGRFFLSLACLLACLLASPFLTGLWFTGLPVGLGNHRIYNEGFFSIVLLIRLRVFE